MWLQERTGRVVRKTEHRGQEEVLAVACPCHWLCLPALCSVTTGQVPGQMSDGHLRDVYLSPTTSLSLLSLSLCATQTPSHLPYLLSHKF